MLKTKVFASNISNLTDARYFAAWEVEWLGFQLATEHPDYLSPQTIKVIKEWVEGPKIAGIFNTETLDNIQQVAEFLELDALVVPMEAPVNELAEQLQRPIIVEVPIRSSQDLVDLDFRLADLGENVSYFLINFEENPLNWIGESFKPICDRYPILIALPPLQATQLATLLDELHPAGLQLKGSTEEKVGFKSFDELDELFELLEQTTT